jgi:hypothetical protein
MEPNDLLLCSQESATGSFVSHVNPHTYPVPRRPFLADFPYYEKIKYAYAITLLPVCVCVSPLLSFERLNQFLLNLVCISLHLSPPHRPN